MRRLVIFWAALAFAVLLGCNEEPEEEPRQLTQEAHLRVVATTAVIADIVVNVGGHLVDVSLLIAPDGDPHQYHPSREDIRMMTDVDIVFYNGLDLEESMKVELFRLGSQVRTIPVTEGIDTTMLLKMENSPDGWDPHVWHDVRMWMIAVEHVRNVLMEMDPVYSEVYARDADVYMDQLSELHDFIYRHALSIQAEKRVIVTAHEAFRYFGRAYGLSVRGLSGINTASDVDPARANLVVRFAVGRKVPVIFSESTVPLMGIETLKIALADSGLETEIAGPLYSDGLGPPGTPEGTYVGMMRYNIETIVSAFGGGGVLVP